MAANIINAIPGASSVPVPVTVSGFSNIGKFTLTLKFDTTRVRFVSANANPALTGMTITYSSPSPVSSKQGKLVFAWTGGSNVSLADGSALAGLVFSYTTGTGILSWSYSYTSVCQYRRYIGGILTVLADDPKYIFYNNGGISNHGAPVTFAPKLTVPTPGPLSVPITVNAFTGIGAMTLNLSYDPAILTYQNTYTKNPAFGSSFTVGNNAGTGGNMLITIQWWGSSLSLANGSMVCSLDFTYTQASGIGCALSWFDNSPSCEYTDGPGDVLIDLPTADYYHDGWATLPLVADFSANNLTPQKNETIQFSDLTTGGATAWNWSFDRPGVVFVNGTTSSSQQPQVEFTDGGPYTVTLLTSNIFLSDTEVKPAYLRAGIPGRWTGNISSDWNTPSNWDNWLIPGSSTDVVIPPSATNWPVIGHLAMGVQCHNLILSGTTSRLTITEDLIINP